MALPIFPSNGAAESMCVHYLNAPYVHEVTNNMLRMQSERLKISGHSKPNEAEKRFG